MNSAGPTAVASRNRIPNLTPNYTGLGGSKKVKSCGEKKSGPSFCSPKNAKSVLKFDYREDRPDVLIFS